VTWTAVIPLKGPGEGKTRLAGRLGPKERRQLVQQLFRHVANVLRQSPAVSKIVLLSDLRPDHWTGDFVADQARGLNQELQSLAEMLRGRPTLIIHADLPLISPDDIAALLADPLEGCAIAPDREGTGTNALALRDPSGFAFAFGVDSFARHLEAAQGGARVVARKGLGLDIDTPDDLDAAMALGFSIEGR
jgi:2-phospho-L-lactate/phosphoenolpyruvate guanylyltransferase